MKKKLLIVAAACIPLLFGAAIIGYQDYQKRSTPGNPASNYLRQFADSSSGMFKCLTSAGTACYFDSANSGSVTSVTCGTGLSGGTITTTGTCAVNLTTTTCTAPSVLTAISSSGVGTCTSPLLTQNSQSAAYTTVLADAGKHIYHPSADTTARTWTIDSNANVAYLLGTPLTFVNDCSAGTITLAITADTLVMAGTGSTGSRTLAACGMATAVKVGSTRWIINGNGLT